MVEDRRVAPNVIVVERGKSGRGGRRNRVEDSQQRVTVAVLVASNQLRVVEVVAGIHADSGRQPAAGGRARFRGPRQVTTP